MGAVSVFVLLVGTTTGCRTGPTEVAIDRPPVTAIRHIDVALLLVHDGPFPLLNEAYAVAASNVAELETETGSRDRAEDLARRLDTYMRRAGEPSGEELLRWARMWNRLASVDAGFTSRAGEVNREVATRLGALEDEATAGPLLVRLLQAQLQNSNAEEESIRRNLDELYLLGDDEVRARALVGAADLIRGEGGLTGLNPVVQQAIAILPAVQSSTAAMILNVRLSELSAHLGNARDVRTLQDQAIRRAETGLLIEPADRPSVRRVMEIFVSRGDRPGAEVIVENIAPVSSRALAYAELGTAAARGARPVPYGLYFEEAFEIAFSIDDPETRGITAAEIILLRVEANTDWPPGSVIADLLGSVQMASLTQEARARILSSLYTALILADRPQETSRLRGLIRSADELALINTSVGETLLSRGRRDAARAQIVQVERFPMTAPGVRESIAYRIARVWIQLEEYDRAITVLLDAERDERARVLVRIPATHRPNPAAVTDLERLLESG